MTTVSIDVSAIPARPAGAGRYVIELVRRIGASNEVELLLLSRTDDRERWRSLAPTARVGAVAPVRRPVRLAWEQLGLRRSLAGVQLHHGPHYTMPVALPMPAVVTIHDVTYFDHPEWHERSKVIVFRKAIRLACRHAAALVCVSQATADRLEELLAPTVPVHVVPHGVDGAVFTPTEPSAGADEVLLGALDVAPPYVLHVGTLEPRKSVAELVRAFDLIAGGNKSLRLVLAGGRGWHSRELETTLREARHADRVIRLGWVDDAALPALLRRAAAVAYPSREEGFGLPALEALACGSPLVTTAGTVMAGVVGKAALLVAPGDTQGLAAALEASMGGGDEMRDRRRLGLDIAREHDWDRSAAAHVRIYQDIVSNVRQ